MVRSTVGLLVGVGLALLLSTISLAFLWGRATPNGSLFLSLIIAVLFVAIGGMVAGIVGEHRTLLLGGLVGLAIGALVGLWPGSFPMKQLFFQIRGLRTWIVPITTLAGLLGGWVAGWLIAPGGFLSVD